MIKNNDKTIRSLQIARDRSDDELWSKTWWGPAAKKVKRRAESLDECKIIVAHCTWKYPVLKFIVLDGRQTIYGVQNYYLRNQWDSEKEKGAPSELSYWYDDSGDSGWMQGAFDAESFTKLLDTDGELYLNASEEQKRLDETEDPGSIRSFTKDEKDIAAECVIPTVKRLDEIMSQEGKTAEDYGYKIAKKVNVQQNERDETTWDTEVLGVEKTLKLRMFKALHLLSIHAF